MGEEVDGVLSGHQLLPRGGVHQLSMYTLAECANSYTTKAQVRFEKYTVDELSFAWNAPAGLNSHATQCTLVYTA